MNYLNKISPYLIGMALFLLPGCKPPKAKVIDINNIPVVEVRDFIDSADFSLVPLQTNDESVLGDISKVVAGKDRLFVWAQDSSDDDAIFVFDKKGTFITKIGTVGRGPGEYLRLRGFDIDDNTRTVHLLDSDLLKVFVYTYEGVFVRELEIPEENTDGYDIACVKEGYVFRNDYLQPVNEEISVTDRYGKALHKYIPRDYKTQSMLPKGPYYFYRMNGEVYFIAFGDDKLFEINDKGDLKQLGELGLKPFMFPYETTFQEFNKGGGRLGPISDLVVNAKGEYHATTFGSGRVFQIFGKINKPGIAMRTFVGARMKPDLTFGMSAIGADGDYFIGYLNAWSALESYPELAKAGVTDESNCVLVYFKFLPKAFEN